MKKLTTFRLDPELLEQVKRSALAENRSVTNYVETALKRAVEVRRPGERTEFAAAGVTPGDRLQSDRREDTH